MKRQVLEDLLTRHADVKVDGDSINVADDAEVSVYIAMGIEPLVIDRISSLKLEGEALVAQTRRNERYLIAYEDLRAVRVHHGGSRTGYAG
jgi:hypothetical protein